MRREERIGETRVRAVTDEPPAYRPATTQVELVLAENRALRQDLARLYQNHSRDMAQLLHAMNGLMGELAALNDTSAENRRYILEALHRLNERVQAVRCVASCGTERPS